MKVINQEIKKQKKTTWMEASGSHVTEKQGGLSCQSQM